jgi:hypothetical protein
MEAPDATTPGTDLRSFGRSPCGLARAPPPDARICLIRGSAGAELRAPVREDEGDDRSKTLENLPPVEKGSPGTVGASLLVCETIVGRSS